MIKYYTYNYSTYELDEINVSISNRSFYDNHASTVKAESIEEANKLYIERQSKIIESFSLDKNVLFKIYNSIWLDIYTDEWHRRGIYMLKGQHTVSSIKSYLGQLGLTCDKRFEAFKIMYFQLNPSVFRIESITKDKIYFTGNCCMKRKDFSKDLFPEFQEQYEKALETYEEKELKKKINFAKKYKDAKKIIEKYNNLSDEEKLQLEFLRNN